MADGIQIRWFLEPWNEMMAEIGPATDRATMYALRAVGRRVRAVARSQAPVYNGTDPRARAERGNLKKSIRSSRRLTHVSADTYQMAVMPVGSKKQGTSVVRYDAGANTIGYARKTGHNAIRTTSGGNSTGGQVRGVLLYRRQMEDQYHYMEAGYAAAEAEAGVIIEEAFAKAWEKWRP